jgi:hypothetical protein
VAWFAYGLARTVKPRGTPTLKGEGRQRMACYPTSPIIFEKVLDKVIQMLYNGGSRGYLGDLGKLLSFHIGTTERRGECAGFVFLSAVHSIAG